MKHRRAIIFWVLYLGIGACLITVNDYSHTDAAVMVFLWPLLLPGGTWVFTPIPATTADMLHNIAQIAFPLLALYLLIAICFTRWKGWDNIYRSHIFYAALGTAVCYCMMG